jgi:hypothetical protein
MSLTTIARRHSALSFVLLFPVIGVAWSSKAQLRVLSRDLAANQIDPARAPVAQTRQKRAR